MKRLPIVALLLATACDGESNAGVHTVRDSAGVQIVESRAPRWQSGTRWRIDSLPAVAIGVEEGAAEYQFSVVRGAIRTKLGRIVVSDATSRQIRIFDSTGAFLAAVGGPGQGPGEFGSSLMRLWQAPAGTLWVNDDGNGRMNVFHERGTFVESVVLRPPAEVPLPSPIGVFADGTVLAMGVVGGPTPDAGIPGRVMRSDASYLQFAPTGDYLREIVRLPGRPRFGYTFRGSTSSSFIPLTSSPVVAPGANGLFVYRGPAAEVEERTTASQLRRILRWNPEVRRVSDVWDAFKRASLEAEGVTPAGRELYRFFHELPLPLPNEVPAVEALLVDEEGFLWARRYRLPWESAHQWDILSPRGEWLGTLTSPAGLSITHLGSRFIVGVHRDGLGIERIRVHRLIRE